MTKCHAYSRNAGARGVVVFSTDTPGNTVGSVLHRQTRIGSGIISVGRGTWALDEWYPNPGRFRKKGADKSGEGESVEPTDAEIDAIREEAANAELREINS
jgi:hypothetical protein